MDGFDDREYAVGVVRGVRSFAAGPDKRLFGPVYGEEWLPGENVAVCLRSRGPRRSFGSYSTAGSVSAAYVSGGSTVTYAQLAAVVGQMNAAFASTTTTFTNAVVAFGDAVTAWGGADNTWADQADRRLHSGWYPDGVVGPRRHSALRCHCGFYAYTRDSDSYPGHEALTGVVEGWGEVIVGARGFRAQRARVVALYSAYEHQREELAAAWPVPVYSRQDAMVAEWPTTLLDDGDPT